MKKILIAGILGGLIMFIWSAFSHMVLPIGNAGFKSLPAEETLLSVLRENNTQSGLYFFPGMDWGREHTSEEELAWMEKHKAGPMGILIYSPQGESPIAPILLLTELFTNIAAALFGAWIISLISASYLKRAVITGILGIICWITISLSYWNWYNFPGIFILAEGFDQLVGWSLAGLAMAKITKPVAG